MLQKEGALAAENTNENPFIVYIEWEKDGEE